MVLAPDDVADPHVGVVRDVGQDEERTAVRLANREVFDVGVLYRHGAAHHVVEGGLPYIRGAKTYQPPGAGIQVAVPAVSVIARRLLARARDRAAAVSGVQSHA